MYKRGSSFETTIPMPLLFGLDPSKKYFVVFNYEKGKWHISFEQGQKDAKDKQKK